MVKKDKKAEPEEKLEDVKVVFVGYNTTADKEEVAALWITVERLEQYAEDGLAIVQQHASLFPFKAATRPRVVGGIYDTKGVLRADGRLERMATRTAYTGVVWGNQSQRVLWMQAQTAMKALEIAQKMKRDYIKAGQYNLLEERLAPLRQIWLQTNTLGRRSLEALVLHALRGGQ